MSHEVDIRAVGEESKSGDAIAFRYGDFSGGRGRYKVVVIDGGFKESGEDLVGHVKRCFKTDHVDLVISSHPDADHVSGLEIVLEQMSVGELWMHRPWERAREIKEFVENHHGTVAGLSDKLKRELDGGYGLEKLARRKGIRIQEPFQGMCTGDGKLVVLGPSEEYYNRLIGEMLSGSPGQAAHGLADQLRAAFRSASQRVGQLIHETWDKDALTEPADDAVSPQNNSSVILLAELDNDFFLFTADAGVPALTLATDFAESKGFIMSARLKYIQVPHHGSKRNVGPMILNRLFGPIVAQGSTTGKTGLISAAKQGEPKHPSRRVTNAICRRGAPANTTQGVNHCYRSLDVPIRPDWGPIQPVPFAPSYDEGDD